MLPGKAMPCFPVFEDNQGAVQLAQNPVTNSNSKNIDVRHRFLREHVRQRDMRPFFIANGKTKKNKYKNVEIPGRKNMKQNCRWLFMRWRKKTKVAGSIPGRPRRFLPPGYRTRSSSSTSDSTSKFATSSLIECYSPYLPIVVGTALFVFVAN